MRIESLATVVEDLNYLYAISRRAGSPKVGVVGAAKLRYAEALLEAATDSRLLTIDVVAFPGPTSELACRVMSALRAAGLDPSWM